MPPKQQRLLSQHRPAAGQHKRSACSALSPAQLHQHSPPRSRESPPAKGRPAMLMASSMGTDTFRCSQLAAGRHKWGRGGKIGISVRRSSGSSRNGKQDSGQAEQRARRLREEQASGQAGQQAIRPRTPPHTHARTPPPAHPGQHRHAQARTLVVPGPDGADALRAGEESAGQHKGAVAVGAPLLKPALPAGRAGQGRAGGHADRGGHTGGQEGGRQVGGSMWVMAVGCCSVQ